MGFFTGPSAEWLSKVALGIASNFLQIMLIDEMDEELQEEMRRNLANEGFETSLGALTKATVQDYQRSQYGNVETRKISRKDQWHADAIRCRSAEVSFLC